MYKIDNFIDYLPFCYRNEYICEILRCIQIEVEIFFSDLIDSEIDYKVSTSTLKIFSWASLLGAEIDNKADIQTQREQIISSMKSNEITTVGLIKSIVESYSNATCDVSEEYNQYKFKIKFKDKVGIPARLDLIKKSIDKIKPAHLNYEFEYKYRTWGDLKRLKITYGQAKEHKFSCKQLREGSISPYDDRYME